LVEGIILLSSIFVLLLVMKKVNVLRTLSFGGRIEKDFRECYIISYPKKAELHNKKEVFDIDLDDFFEQNPQLKGKIPVERRRGISSMDPSDIQVELQERKKIARKYSGFERVKAKRKH